MSRTVQWKTLFSISKINSFKTYKTYKTIFIELIPEESKFLKNYQMKKFAERT
jgi:hypothetical protein